MAEDQTNTVRTIFTIVDRAAAPLRAIGSAAMQLPDMLGRVTGALGGLQGVIGALGAGAAITTMVALNSQAEDLEMSITGTLRAYEVVGPTMAQVNAQAATAARTALGISQTAHLTAQQTAAVTARSTEEAARIQDDAFGQVLVGSRQVIQQIRTMAAALPGEEEDFTTAFRNGLSAMISTNVGSMEQMASFSSRFTAIAIANQVSAVQAASDLPRILQGHAGMLTPSWRALQGVMHMSAEEFNRLRPDERVRRMNAAFDQYNGLLARFGNTWSAVYSTSVSMVKNFARIAGEGMFTRIRDGLHRVNDSIQDGNGHLTTFGQRIYGIAHTIDHQLSRSIDEVASRVREFRGEWSGPEAGGFGGAVHGLVNRFTSQSRGAQVSQAIGAAGTLAGFPGFSILVRAVMSLGRDMGFLHSVAAPAASIFAQVTPIMDRLGESVATIVRGVLPGLMSGLSAVIGPIGSLLDTLGPALAPAAQAVGGFLAQLGPAVASTLPALRIAAEALTTTVQAAAAALSFFTSILTAYNATNAAAANQERANADVATNNILLREMSGIEDALGSARGTFASITQGLNLTNEQIHALGQLALQHHGDAIRQALDNMRGHREVQAAAAQATQATLQMNRRNATRTAATTHNDFRNSRFDIRQQFAQGFDPDRIAVAFSSDLAVIGERRLQSGFAPLFSVR